jgi:hypothetical protein
MSDGLKDGGLDKSTMSPLEKDKFGRLREMLQEALPPIDELGSEAELRCDLWPDMLRRLEQPAVRVPWFDWALLAVSGAATILFPALIPALLYHL